MSSTIKTMPNENIKLQLSNSQISDWVEKIEGSERVLEENHLPVWRSVQQAYSAEGDGSHGDLDGLHYEDGETVNFNFLLANANTIIPGVISANPYIYVKPRRPGDKESARIAETALNYVWREIDGNKTTRSVVLDTILFGLGVAKVGYDGSGSFYTEEDYDTGPEKPLPGEEDENGLNADQRRQLRRLLADDNMSFEEGPEDNPSFTRVAPWDLIVPPGYTELKQCPWVCERMVVRLDDLRADDRFNVPKELKPDAWLEEAIPSSLSGHSPESNGSRPETEPEYVVLYEIRYWGDSGDGLRRYVMWMIKNPGTGDAQDSILRHIPDPIEMKGYPYEVIRFVDVPNSFYSTKVSDLCSIKDIAGRLNDEWAYILRHHRLSSRRKFIAAPGSLESGQLASLLESEEDMAVAEVPASVARIQDALMILPEAPPPSTTPMVIQGLARLMYEISGIDSFQRGGASRKGTTATEVAIASAATKGRVGMRLEATEKFISNISRKMLAIIRQYWDEVRYLRIDGDSGEDEFISFTAADIQGYYDVDIQAGSTIPTDPAEEQRAFMGLLQTIQGVAATLAPLVQGGVLPPDAIQNFMDQSFRVWRQDKRALVGPLSQLQGAAISAGAAGQAMEDPQVQGVEDTGMGAVGEPLAGTGPREVAPSSAEAVMGRFQR